MGDIWTWHVYRSVSFCVKPNRCCRSQHLLHKTKIQAQHNLLASRRPRFQQCSMEQPLGYPWQACAFRKIVFRISAFDKCVCSTVVHTNTCCADDRSIPISQRMESIQYKICRRIVISTPGFWNDASDAEAWGLCNTHAWKMASWSLYHQSHPCW